MQLGNFSISLAVKDIAASRLFYETLGFSMVFGDLDQGWAIMKNGETNIGLFQGMFERNTLTFNPGWDHNASELERFTDIREIQSKLKESGIQFAVEAAEGNEPASFMIFDPDGNPILVDQHVASRE